MNFRRNKYRVSPAAERTWHGRVWASKAEMQYAQMLAMGANSVYRLVICQPKILLGVEENVYIPDFFVIDADGAYYFVDVKGVETAAFKKVRKLWAAYGPAKLYIAKKRGKYFVYETIEEGTKAGVGAMAIPRGGAAMNRWRKQGEQ